MQCASQHARTAEQQEQSRVSEPQQGREPGVRLKLAVALICLVAALASGGLTVLFLHRSEDSPSANFAMPSPQMVLLTDQPNASATYSVAYYQGSLTSPGETQYLPADSVAPVDTRRMTFRIHVALRTQHLRFAILLNDDASLTAPTVAQGPTLSVLTVPPRLDEIPSASSIIQPLKPAQLLSGNTDVHST